MVEGLKYFRLCSIMIIYFYNPLNYIVVLHNMVISISSIYFVELKYSDVESRIMIKLELNTQDFIPPHAQ